MFYCYFNLHKKVFSAKNLKTGRVDKDKYSKALKLENCHFKVSEAGRQRVIREKRKNVHAGVVGDVVGVHIKSLDHSLDELIELTYNPYKYDSFVVKETGERVKKADTVYLLDRKIFAKNIS